MRWAIIGNGYIAKKHIESISHIGDELAAVCDIDPAKEITGIPFFLDYKDLFISDLFKTIDCVAVLTPNDTHREISLRAVYKGKKVLCEKPFILHPEELVFFTSLKKIFLVHQLRYHPVLLKIKTESSPFKAELVIKVRRDTSYWSGWKGNQERSGGIIYNLGVHYFDILVYLFGKRFKLLHKDIQERKATGLIEFANGYVNFALEISELDVGERYLEVNGERYHFSNKDNLSEENLHLKVYEEFKKGRGVRPKQVKATYKLLKQLE